MSDIGKNEAADIDKIVSRILNDLGNPEPPIALESVRELLKLDLRFYDTNDPSTIDEVVHKMKMAGKQMLARPTLLLDAIKKANISALWMPDTKRIMIDQTIPGIKYRCRWIEAHEITHSFTPWHRDFLFGDNEFTLDPACHALVEGEANYGAGRLLFLQERFANDARDVDLSFYNIKRLAKIYGNTITSTLWRIIEEREPNRPTFGMISQHPKYPDIGPEGIETPWKHFIRSDAFRNQFSNITPDTAYKLLQNKANNNKKGTIVNDSGELMDINGDRYEFRIESFCNTYTLLTYGAVIKKLEVVV